MFRKTLKISETIHIVENILIFRRIHISSVFYISREILFACLRGTQITSDLCTWRGYRGYPNHGSHFGRRANQNSGFTSSIPISLGIWVWLYLVSFAEVVWARHATRFLPPPPLPSPTTNGCLKWNHIPLTCFLRG